MESQFEPVARTEETSVARIIILDLPGFRKEDLRVQLDNRGSLIISGEERRVKETEETRKVSGALEKMQRGGRKFRKIISVPENLNVNGITARFKDETLHITLPLRPISDQQNQKAVPESRTAAVPASGKPDQAVQSKVERSSPAGQEESMEERSGVAQDDQRAKQSEAIRQEDDKAKGAVAKAAEVLKGLEEEISAAAKGDQSARDTKANRPDDDKLKAKALAEESKELRGGEIEAPKNGQDTAAGALISKDPKQELPAVSQGDRGVRLPEAIRPDDDKLKAKAAAKELKELLGGRNIEAPKHAQDIAAGALISKDPKQELPLVSQGDGGARQAEAIRPHDDKFKAKAAAEESKEFLGVRKFEVPKHGQDIAAGALISKEPKQELSAVSQGDQGAIQAETIRPDDNKSKRKAAAEESKELLRGKKEEVPKHAQDFVGAGEPVSKEPKQEQFAVAQKDQSPRHPEEIQSADLKEAHSAAVQEPKESPEKKKEETPKQAKDFVHEDPTILSHTQAVAAQTGSDRDQSQFIQSSKKDEEKLQQERNSDEDEGEQADDEVEEETGEEEDDSDEEEDDSDEERGEEEDESDERRLPLPSDEFPHRVIQIPSSSGPSIFSKEKVLLASTVLALSVGLFLSHILSSRSSDLEP